MARALSICSTPGCPTFTARAGQCDDCRSQADQRRGSAHQRGYGKQHRGRFRTGVLARDRTCVLCGEAPSTVADHWPLSRRELVARGMDPDEPSNGRGCCASCHGKATAAEPDQRGGWNAR